MWGIWSVILWNVVGEDERIRRRGLFPYRSEQANLRLLALEICKPDMRMDIYTEAKTANLSDFKRLHSLDPRFFEQ